MEKFKQYYQAIKGFVVRRPYLTAILVIIAAGGGWWYYSGNKQTAISSVLVKKGTVSQVVSVTGTVKPANEVKLSFEKSGRVAVVYHEVGDRVSAGAYLVALDSADISAQLLQAKAVVKSNQAKLEELKNGTRPEDLLVSQVSVQNAVNDATNDIKNGYVNTDDAIRNKVDQFILNSRSAAPQLSFTISDSQLKINIENGRPILEKMLTSWNSSLETLPNTSDVRPFINEAKENLRMTQDYLDKIALAVNSLTTNSNISQSTIDGYKAAIVLGRSNVTAALNSLTASEEKLNNALSQLALKEAGTVSEQITAQEAVLEGSQASVLNLEAQLAKTVMVSPIGGVVTKQEAKVGETVPVSTPIVSVISESKYEIQANIPEADISKVKIGDVAEVTLDAYGSDVLFNAAVTEIDPAETIIDGVATYKTTLQFKDNDSRIKSGMTANTDIYGDKHENVLYIPGRTVSTKDKVKTVNVVGLGNSLSETVITTGLRGSNGDVEILSGLKEGDKVKTN